MKRDFIVQKKVSGRLFLSSIFAVLLLAGCGMKSDNLTKQHTGRRVGDYDVDGMNLAYVWYPAQHMSVQGHLVVLDLITGAEKELESNLSGPMAMCSGHVVWWNSRKRDNQQMSDVIAYNLDDKKQTVIAHARVHGLDADGDRIVWSETYEGYASDIILYDLETGEQKTISSGGKEGDMMHRDPRIGDGTVAWEAYDRKTRNSKIAIYDIEAEELSTVDIQHDRPRLSVSGDHVVYLVREGGTQDVHLYDISAEKDKVIASLDRLKGTPYIEGDKIVWCEHVRKENFKGIPGQPLMDEEDIRDVFVYNVGSGNKRMLAKYLMSIGGKIGVHNGRVYLPVYRDYPPPGSSNLVVSVDLLVW